MDRSKRPVPVILRPDTGRRLSAFGEQVVIHAGAAETGGRCAWFTNTTPPGGGPPPHWHDAEDEWFVVREGKVSFLADGQWQEPVGPGAMVFAPRGSVHAFKNTGDTPLVMLVMASPAGFETFFARCAEEFARPGSPDMGRIAAIAEEHGIHFAQ